MRGILKVLSQLLAFVSMILFVVSILLPLYTSSSGQSIIYYNQIVNPLIPFFLIVAVLCGLSLAIFCRRREARLFGYALTIASAIYCLQLLYWSFISRNTIWNTMSSCFRRYVVNLCFCRGPI